MASVGCGLQRWQSGFCRLSTLIEMKQDREDQLSMCGRVADYLADNEDRIADSPMAAEQAAEVQAQYAKVDGAAPPSAPKS